MRGLIKAFLIVLLFSTSVFAQGSAPIKVQEVDGSPSGIPTKLIFQNGRITKAGSAFTIADQTGGAGSAEDIAFDATWDGSDTATSKNTIYDKFNAMGAAADHVVSRSDESDSVPYSGVAGVHAGTNLSADLEEEVTEGSLADSVIVSADIKDGVIVDADMANDALDADKIVGDSTDDDDLDVAAGGTGVSTLMDGGILLGSGAGDITALGVATNGQIPIGDGTTDPVLATIAGDNGITITNGAGTITVVLNQVDVSDSTNLTAGDALTLTGDDIDFDGGASPGGELGGTWDSPTLDDSVAVASWNLTTPTITTSLTTDSKTISEAEIGVLDGGIEGTEVLSTGEAGAVKFLREDGDGTCSWQTPAGSGDMTKAIYDTDENDIVDTAEELAASTDYGELSTDANGAITLDDSITVANWNLGTSYVAAEAYDDSGWDSDTSIAQKDAIRDKFNALGASADNTVSRSDETDSADWSDIQNIPAGFADGTDDTGGSTKMKFEKGISVETPVANDQILIYKSRYAWTANNLSGAIEPDANDSTDTASVSFWECNDHGDSEVLIGTITITSDAETDSTLTGTAIDADDWVMVYINSIGGNPTQVTPQIDGTED